MKERSENNLDSARRRDSDVCLGVSALCSFGLHSLDYRHSLYNFSKDNMASIQLLTRNLVS